MKISKKRLKKIIKEELLCEEDRLGLTPDNGAIGLEEDGAMDTLSPALEGKIVGKGYGETLIKKLQDVDKSLGLFDLESLNQFPEVQSELIELALSLSEKLKYLKDSTRTFRERRTGGL